MQVSTDGTVWIGAPHETVDGKSHAGAVYAVHKGQTKPQRYASSTPSEWAYFGKAIQVAPDEGGSVN